MSENELKHFNFDLEKVKDFGRNIEDRKERKKYFKDVLFLKKHNKILIDHSLYAPYNFDREIKREIKLLDNGNDELKKDWKGTKGEFATFVNDVYLEDQKTKQKEYLSLRDASNKLYDEHNFRWKDWTKEQCYDIVKKK